MFHTIFLGFVLATFPQQKAEPPVFKLTWHDGMRIWLTPQERKQESYTTQVAIWANGRAIWRSPELAWKELGSKTVYAPGVYYEGYVAPAKITAAISRLKQAGLFRREHREAVALGSFSGGYLALGWIFGSFVFCLLLSLRYGDISLMWPQKQHAEREQEHPEVVSHDAHAEL